MVIRLTVLLSLEVFFSPGGGLCSSCATVQFAAHSEGDHAQSILGLFGRSVEGGSTVLQTSPQTRG